MELRTELAKVYADAGPNHFMPFVGDGFERGTPGTFRVMVVGINAYISDGDGQAPEEMRGWYADWWKNAACGRGNSHAFFSKSFNEADRLSAALVGSSPPFQGLRHDGDPNTKTGFYGTNAVKVYLGGEHATADAITPELLEPFRSIWHAELNVLARRNVLPHLIIALGEKVWEHMWQAFHDEHYRQPDFKVVEYEACREDSDAYHFANRCRVETTAGAQPILLVRIHHPSRPGSKRAAWLLEQSEFRRLAELAR